MIFRLTLFGEVYEFNTWKDIVAYEAETKDGRVFIREQVHRILWYKKRRIIHSSPDTDD
jgi:hypothetical protein